MTYQFGILAGQLGGFFSQYVRACIVMMTKDPLLPLLFPYFTKHFCLLLKIHYSTLI
jgi:hypothetical protein